MSNLCQNYRKTVLRFTLEKIAVQWVFNGCCVIPPSPRVLGATRNMSSLENNCLKEGDFPVHGLWYSQFMGKYNPQTHQRTGPLLNAPILQKKSPVHDGSRYISYLIHQSMENSVQRDVPVQVHQTIFWWTSEPEPQSQTTCDATETLRQCFLYHRFRPRGSQSCGGSYGGILRVKSSDKWHVFQKCVVKIFLEDCYNYYVDI